MGLFGGRRQSMTERSGGKEHWDETLHPDPVFLGRDMAAIHSLGLSTYPPHILIQLPRDILFMKGWGYTFLRFECMLQLLGDWRDLLLTYENAMDVSMRLWVSSSYYKTFNPPPLPPEKNEGQRHYSFLKYLGLEHFILTMILKPLPFPFSTVNMELTRMKKMPFQELYND